MDFLKDPRIRLILPFFILCVGLLYSFYFKRKEVDIIPTVNAIYVSPHGGDIEYDKRNFKTVTLIEGIKNLEAGKTLYLFPGEYKEEIQIKFKGSEEKPISLQAAKGAEISGSCISITDSSWIFLENLSLKNCTTSSLKILRSENIYISRLNFADNILGIHAQAHDTKNIVIEKSNWTSTRGIFFSSEQVSGDIVLRKNQISGGDTAISMVADLSASIGNQNSHVQIYENKFENLNSKVIHAEGSSYNWWIHHNEIKSDGTWHSFADVKGGFFYIYANIGNSKEKETSAVFHLPEDNQANAFPIYIFHNTWLFTKEYILNTSPVHLIRHFNNILMPKEENREILRNEFYSPTLKFDHDLISTKQDSSPEGSWKNAVFADPLFSKTDKGDPPFSLSKESPAIDAGVPLKIGNWEGEYFEKAPDIGAFESKFEIKGPKYFRRPVQK